MSVVIDASLTLAWYFEDERTTGTDAVLDRVTEEGAIVPALWRLEVANGLQMATRRQRIAPPYRDQALRELTELPITVDGEGDAYAWTSTLALADQHGLTIYDASYLEVAQRRRVPLATQDGALIRAAQAVRVELVAL